MFFEYDSLNPVILDVLYLDQYDSKTFNSGRNFHALSFRFKAKTKIKTVTKEYNVGDNTITFFPARTEYTRIAERDQLIAVHFYLDGNYFQEIECKRIENAEIYAKLFQELFDCWTEKKAGYRYECSSIFYAILANLHAEFHGEKETNTNYDKKIKNSVEFLRKTYTNPEITIEKIAKESYVSEVYFRKLFKAQFGISPKKYLVHLRIEHAKQLIETGYYTLQEIAYLSGFTDYKYFSVEFKRTVGISPSKYGYHR